MMTMAVLACSLRLRTAKGVLARTMHDLSRGASPKDWVDLAFLFFVGRRRVRH
jgi:hypothetical protein